MKKRIAIISSTILVAAALIAAPVVFAEMHGRMGGHGGRGGHGFGMGMNFLGHLAEIRDELDLTDAQADQIHAIFREVHEQNVAYREQMHGGFKDIAKTLIANPNDIAGAQAKLDAQEAAERVMKTNMLTAASKALNVLTPQQRTKLADLLEQHAQRMEQRRSR